MSRYKIIVILLLPALMAGCTPTPEKSVVNFVEEAKKPKPKKIIVPMKLPEPKAFKYSANTFRDPFIPYYVATAEKEGTKSLGGPDPERPRQALEAFSMDALKMVGTLEREGVISALIRDNSGTLHRVAVGTYMGQHSGKIMSITDDGIDVQEWVTDGKGGWKEQKVTLTLTRSNGC